MSKETITKQTSDESQKRKRKAEQTQMVLPYPSNALQRLTNASALRPDDILSLQQTVGNQAVQRRLAESGRPERETNDGKTGLGVIQRQEHNNDAKIAELHSRVSAEELISDAIIDWTHDVGPKIKANKEKVDKVGDYVKNSVVPWETKATNEINSLRERVANLESASSKESTP